MRCLLTKPVKGVGNGIKVIYFNDNISAKV